MTGARKKAKKVRGTRKKGVHTKAGITGKRCVKKRCESGEGKRFLHVLVLVVAIGVLVLPFLTQNSLFLGEQGNIAGRAFEPVISELYLFGNDLSDAKEKMKEYIMESSDLDVEEQGVFLSFVESSGFEQFQKEGVLPSEDGRLSGVEASMSCSACLGEEGVGGCSSDCGCRCFMRGEGQSLFFVVSE